MSHEYEPSSDVLPPQRVAQGQPVCMYIYIYIYTHTHIYICIYIFICMYIYIYRERERERESEREREREREREDSKTLVYGGANCGISVSEQQKGADAPIPISGRKLILRQDQGLQVIDSSLEGFCQGKLDIYESRIDPTVRVGEGRGRPHPNFIRTSVCDKHSGSTKFTTRLDHISHCQTASGTNRSNRWTYRVFIINAHRD